MKTLNEIVRSISTKFGYEYESIQSFINIETGGKGFNGNKLIIQFEPSWFKKREPYAPSGAWSVNKVERQVKEWIAFNNAFSIDPDSAMESTSIGIGQVMGGNWKRLGYKSVGEMWDDAKKGIDRQVWQMCQFIHTDKELELSLKRHDWCKVAYIYNGSGYRALAKKYNRVPYDVSMSLEYTRLKWKTTESFNQ